MPDRYEVFEERLARLRRNRRARERRAERKRAEQAQEARGARALSPDDVARALNTITGPDGTVYTKRDITLGSDPYAMDFDALNQVVQRPGTSFKFDPVPPAPIQGNIGFDPDAPSVRVISAVERMTKYVPKRGEVIGVVGNVHVAADGSIMSEVTLDGTNHRLLPDELWRNRND